MTAEEPGHCYMLRIDPVGVADEDGCRWVSGHGLFPESVGLEERGDRAPHG